MKIRKLTQRSSTEFYVVWDDGHEGPIQVRRLRDTCPCAGCKGEKVLFHEYVPPEPDRTTPGRYDVIGVETVGGYAMKFSWGDGHDLGIYTWKHLRRLCSCPDCLAKMESPDN